MTSGSLTRTGCLGKSVKDDVHGLNLTPVRITTPPIPVVQVPIDEA
jgi:hypothetical protein